MQRAFVVLIFAGLLAAGGAPAEATSAVGGKPLVEKYTLANGLTVVLRENHSSPVVAVQVWVKAGSTTEPEARAGMSHILEHMAFKGTKRRGPGQIAREVEALGGEINAYTSFDQTVYHITISGRYLGEALDLLADTLGNSVFDPNELARELEVILEELRMNEDNPGRTNWKALMREAYRVHAYGRPVIGYADTIRKTTRDDLVSYFARYYTPRNMVLVVAGDVDPKTSRPLIEKTFLPLGAESGAKRSVPAEPPQTETRVKVQEREARRAYIDLGFHGPSMRDEDVFAWDLLGMILGSGQTSRLYREVKDRRGLVDGISASSWTPEDPGLMVVEATGDAGKAKEALRETLRQVFRMTVAAPEGPELARAKTGTESDFLYSLESQSALARHVGFYETTLGDAAFEQQYLRKIRSVTAEDILRVARAYLSPSNLTVAAVVPRGEAALLPEGEIRAIADGAYREVVNAAEKAGRTERVAKEVLENGIRLIVREDHSVPVVAIEAGFLGALRAEKSATPGVSSMTAEMLTKGTKTRTAREIAESAENIAADLAGFSGRNAFGLRARFLRRDLEQGFRLFAESLLSPSFPPEELAKKKEEVLGRLKLQKDDLTQATILLFLAAHYGDHPYGRNPLGTEASVRGMTVDDLKAFYARWADPRNLVVAVSGDIGVEEAALLVRTSLGNLPRREGYVPIGPLPVPPEAGIRKAAETRNKQQAHFIIGYTGARFTDPEHYAMDVLGSALAGMGGRLFTNLRDRKSLAYSVTSFSSEQVDPGFFAFYMGTSADKLEGAIADTLKEIAGARRGGVTREELERAKKWMIGRHEINLQSNASYADSLMYNELYDLGYEETFKFPAKIQAVTLEDVNRVAARILSTERYTIAVTGGPTGQPKGE